MIRRTATIGALAAALVTVLSGCTIATTLSGGGAPMQTEDPGITVSDGYSPDPVTEEPTPTDDGDDAPPEWVDQTDVQVALGESITIEGRSGNPVGTFQVNSVNPHFTACTDEEYAPSDDIQYVEVTFNVTAEDALAAEDDSWDYPTSFELYLADVLGPDGERLSNSLGFDCQGISNWRDTVEPGQSLPDGVIYLEVEAFGDAGMIEWDYGHQNFQVPFP